MRVPVVLGSIFVLSVWSPLYNLAQPGVTAARVSHASVPGKTTYPVRSLGVSIPDRSKAIQVAWKTIDSTLKLNQTTPEGDRPLPRLPSTLSVAFGKVDAVRGFSSGKPPDWFFPFKSTFICSDQAPETSTTTGAFAPRDRSQSQVFSFHGDYLTIQVCTIRVQVTNATSGVIRFRDIAFVTARKIESPIRSTNPTSIKRNIPPATLASPGMLFRFPSANFFKISIPVELAPEMLEDLPPGEEFLIVWGTGYLQDDNVHSTVPDASIETVLGTASIAAQNGENSLTRDVKGTNVIPIEREGPTADLVITWFKSLNQWLVTDGSRAPPLLPC